MTLLQAALFWIHSRMSVCSNNTILNVKNNIPLGVSLEFCKVWLIIGAEISPGPEENSLSLTYGLKYAFTSGDPQQY